MAETDYERRTRETNEMSFFEKLELYKKRIKEGKPVGILKKSLERGSDETDSCSGSRIF